MELSFKQDKIKTQYVIPERAVVSEGAHETGILLTAHPRQALLSEAPICTLQKGGFVLLDFGCEFQGGADIVIQLMENNLTKLRLVFGESVSEALSAIGEKNATNDLIQAS